MPDLEPPTTSELWRRIDSGFGMINEQIHDLKATLVTLPTRVEFEALRERLNDLETQIHDVEATRTKFRMTIYTACLTLIVGIALLIAGRVKF